MLLPLLSGNLMLMEIFLLMFVTRSAGYLKVCLTGSCILLSSLTFAASDWISASSSVGNPSTVTGYTFLCVFLYHLSNVGKSARLCRLPKQELRALC